MSFSEKLRLEREKLGYKQKDFAEKLNLPANTYNGYETGKRSPSLEVVKDIADYLDVSIDYLLDRDKYYIKDNTTPYNYIDYSPEDFQARYLTVEYLVKGICYAVNKINNAHMLRYFFIMIYTSMEDLKILDKNDKVLSMIRNTVVHTKTKDEYDELQRMLKEHSLKDKNK